MGEFRGTYDPRHAVRGLRWRCLPVLRLAAVLGLCAAALSVVSDAAAALVAACAASVACFAVGAYRRQAAEARRRGGSGAALSGRVAPEGLTLRTAFGEVRRPWVEFRRAQALPGLILLHDGDGREVALPREFFAPRDWRLARAIVRRTAPARRAALPARLQLALGTALALAVALGLAGFGS